MRSRAVLLAVLAILVVLELTLGVLALVGQNGDEGAVPSATPTAEQTDLFTFTPRPDTSPRLQATAPASPTATAAATPTPGTSPTAQATAAPDTIAMTGPELTPWLGFIPLVGGIGLAIALRRLR